jgi:hypothetical protein
VATKTRNLHLVLDDNLTANSRANLQKLDSLGAVFNLDNTQSAVIRSVSDLYFRPHDAGIGGSGTGGNVTFGQAGQPLDSVKFYTNSISISGYQLGLQDAGTGGTKKLNLVYNSSLSGPIDTSADRTVSFDLNGSDRQLILAGNFNLGGNFSSDSSLSFLGSSLSVSAPISTSWVLPSTLGASGQALTTNGAGTLSWTTITGGGSNQSTSVAWTSGISLLVTHNFGTQRVIIQVLDADNNYENVDVQMQRPTLNTALLTATSAPTNWLVLLTTVS